VLGAAAVLAGMRTVVRSPSMAAVVFPTSGRGLTVRLAVAARVMVATRV